MPDEDGFGFSQRLDQADDITGQFEQVVFPDCLRFVGFSITALIGNHHMIPGLGKHGDLMPPGIPRFRKTVTEDDQRPFALFGQVHSDAVGFDVSKGQCVGFSSPAARAYSAGDQEDRKKWYDFHSGTSFG